MTQSKIVDKLRNLGYKVTVLTASVFNRGGIPDTLVSYNGKAIWVEIKIDKDELSALQKHFAEEFWASWCCLHYDSDIKRYGTSVNDTSVLLFARELQDKLNGLEI